MKEFKFSVVMAAYNTEMFLREAVESLLAQDIGFLQHVQLILVDDGSTDGTGRICDEYGKAYPENVVVCHKENGGAASARNEGLKHVRGQYVSFLDSDDKLSSNAMELVDEFFVGHIGEIDLVTLPLEFFDGKDGEHILNYKFKRGSRVIDLETEHDAIQLHLTSSFVTREATEKMEFDTRLSYAEDAKECVKVLLRKHRLGVVSEARCFYRWRQVGAQSAIQQSGNSSGWYLPYLEHFSYALLDMGRQEGEIPRFIQYTVMYDMQWRFRCDFQRAKAVLGEEKAEEFREKSLALLKYIDDDIILAQRQLYASHKCFLMEKKHGILPHMQRKSEDVEIVWGAHVISTISQCAAKLEFLHIRGDGLLLEGYAGFIGERDLSDIRIFLQVNGKEFLPCEICPLPWDRVEGAGCMGETIFLALTFRCQVESLSKAKDWSFKIYTEYHGAMIERKLLQFGWRFPVLDVFQNAYAARRPWIIKKDGNQLLLHRVALPGLCWQEGKLLLELAQKKQAHYREALILRGLRFLLRPFLPKDIWIVSDRINKADDNGEAFFRYIHETRRAKHAYFVLRKDSEDYGRVSRYGTVLEYGSFRHKLMHLLAEKIISSAADDHVENPFGHCRKYYWDILREKQQVFLQHGITKDDLSGWINRHKKDLAMIVTAAIPERQSMLEGKYYYDSSVVKLTGFPRYDYLENRPQRIIAIMPTWRHYLGSAMSAVDGLKQYGEGFQQTGFFRFYDALLNHPRLLEAVREHGYRLCFMPHPYIIPALSMFHRPQEVEFCSIHTRYCDLFAQSALMVTDYSSVAFDFAYLGKPVIYCQFDREEFFSQHTYTKGYFDYERDGFGEVEQELEGAVARISEYLEHGCQMKDIYQSRAEKFFAYRDRQNCQRVYEAVMALDK